MKTAFRQSRRQFLRRSGIALGSVGLARFGPWRAAASAPQSTDARMLALRRAVVDSPVGVGLHRARVFTEVFQQRERDPWIVRKAAALREYLATVPLYLREHDGFAGAISETPGALPLLVELGLGECGIYTSERPERQGYLQGRVPDDIRTYWMNRNMWGRYRTEILGHAPYAKADEVPRELDYKFISNQGHLSPRYSDLLRGGLAGIQAQVRQRRAGNLTAEQRAFLDAAELSLEGVAAWARRYGEFLGGEARRTSDTGRAAELREMARIAGKVASAPPETFREALQLIWFVHQAIHLEGHGYSCTPDRLDQLLLPFYEADRRAGRIDDAAVVRLTENFVLKMYDNSFWGPEHHLTQGFVVGGSTPDGRDQTNRLSWLMLEAATNLALPEPLIWVRWHSQIDEKFFDFALTRLSRTTCFPMWWNDRVVPEGLMALGVDRADAFNYVPVGCNELGIPGQLYYNPGAHVGYLPAIEAALTGGKGYKNQWKPQGPLPAPAELATFDAFTAAVGAHIRTEVKRTYDHSMRVLRAQMQWGQTPFTSCFFDGCLAQARDLTQGTKYNILSTGGIAFANAVDCLASVREVVYEKKQATLAEVAAACAANFKGHERLRARLLAAPKHGNDDPRIDDLIRLVERLRDEPVKAICRDPRDGSPFGNSHVVRSGAVKQGQVTPATPDGRLAGTPVANSVAVCAGQERGGPTATLNSVCKLNAAQSWQSAYQVNIRFQAGMIADETQRAKLRAMLHVYFERGGQELQINVVDSATLRAAQKNPEQFRDLVVRIAGFSEFFVNLTPAMQEEIIARTEHI
jgi:formate C-acetyltransferase